MHFEQCAYSRNERQQDMRVSLRLPNSAFNKLLGSEKSNWGWGAP